MTEQDVHDTIVVIDDDYAMRLSCEQILGKSGYGVRSYEDGARGLEGVAELKPSLVVVDLKMPGLSGIEVIPRIHEIDPGIVIVVITGYATIGTAVDAMKAGAYDFLPKPFSPDELRLIVRRGLERRRLVAESQQAEIERELMKRRFVTFVSHQLKTPLVAVHQFLEVLQRLGDNADASAKRREWTERCLVRTTEMRTLINNWLTLSQLGGGTLSRHRVDLDVRELLAHVVGEHAESAARQDIRLELTPGVPLPVHGDRTCLSVLFENLIANAVKYNRPGGSVRVEGTVDSGEVVVAVTDTGLGIPAGDLPYLFDEFYRVRRSGDETLTGTGLGLPISRRVALEMGGAIEVESTEGAGSTFRVRLPSCPAPSSKTEPIR
ncbi:MAG: hybrid sensor histidine kinase/response regulator [Gemmatimonadota bacterium]|nr:hybrid sensor histidine kinase/response regulator [Gemmatimonadota bacterium]MDH3367738.1 hybrid sensor histidine kinase/response regulator [Gemmatimonadota bacterium]MDH3479292.1 hybrid sensor histidine kinase/response regulator [Gemmatimonadota bacterium]MDH3570920.1 hybrid sensor histidine kinase/response regulator [Gemmatimonadota bacterium]MDH5548996.1 hybrid sensor histidine kinase/response regulator [Gemmatimonadota bacterium]